MQQQYEKIHQKQKRNMKEVSLCSSPSSLYQKNGNEDFKLWELLLFPNCVPLTDIVLRLEIDINAYMAMNMTLSNSPIIDQVYKVAKQKKIHGAQVLV